MKDRATGRARGFGFVVFADPAVAERVVMEKHLIDGRNVSCYVLILNNLGFER
jgi:RNA-binding protein Musashi